MAIVPLGPDHQVWQLRAQWSDGAFNGGESSWSFVTLRSPSDDGSELYGLWVTYLQGIYCSARPDDWNLERVLVEDRWPHTRATLVVDYSGGFAPDSSGAPAPVQVGPIITWYSDHPGRSYRGRTYWGQIRAADIDNGWHLGGDAEGYLFEFAFVMHEQFGPFAAPDVPTFAIVSRQHNGVIRDTPVYVQVTGWSDRQYLTTIRKRNHTPQIFG